MRRITFLIASIYYFTACNNEAIYMPEHDVDEMKPQIELLLNDAETVNLYSSATLSENTIDTVWVLAFNSSGVKQWVEIIEGSRIVRNGYASQLLPQLAHEPQTGWTIVCIANVDPVLDTVNVNLSNINDRFTIMESFYYGNDFLPMYGQFVWNPANGSTCEMTRAVAKIQVQMGTSVSIADSVGNFSAENVHYRLYYAGGAGTVQPPASGVSSGGYRSTNTNPRYILQSTAATEQNSNTYIYEYPSSNRFADGSAVPQPISGGDTAFHENRLHLILEKDNMPDPPTFYRLDFYNPVTGRFIDIVRNHHYIFTINSVRSEGYRSFAQAQSNPGSNIEYSIVIKDEATRMASNGQYAIVTTGGLDTLDFRFDVFTPPITGTLLKARYYFPDEMGGVMVPGTLNSIEVQTLTGPVTNAFTLASSNTLGPTFAGGAGDVNITVSAGTLNGTLGVVIFRLGNIKHRVYFRLNIP